MRRPSRPGLSLVLALCACIPLSGQNLTSLGKEKPFSFTGGMSINQIAYTSAGMASRRDPYSFLASGNLNLSLYGWTVPLRFTFSDRNTTFSQPFNQYALHPTWKWITAHAGYTSLSFSPYTVSGHIFLGGAVELEPVGDWKVSALYGRFLKATPARPEANRGHGPSFQRKGYGAKIAFNRGGKFADVIVFGAEDEERSIPSLSDSLQIFPEQNMVISVGGGTRFLQRFLFKAEAATSAITRDVRTEKTLHDHLLAKTGWFTPRLSSSYYNAIKGSLDYQHNGWMLGFAYEKIDPGYRTHGAYYFNNDLENITVNTTAGLLNNTMNIAISTGLQRDNLDRTKVSTLRRMVGSINVNYAPSQRLNLSAAWSSFQTFTNIRSAFETINQLTPYENLDTLNFTQISRSSSLSVMYTLSATETKRQQFNFQLNAQHATEKHGEVQAYPGTRFYNSSLGYNVSLIPQNLGLSLTLTATMNRGASIDSRMVGPMASITRAFLQRKCRTSFSASYNETYSYASMVSRIFNMRCTSVVALREKHNVNLSLVLSQRHHAGERASGSTTELTSTLGYSYSFGSRSRPTSKNQ